MAIYYRQSSIDYREANYSYQGVETHAIAAAITSTATVAATLVEVAIIDAGEAAITSTTTVAATLIEEAIIDAGEAAITATATAAAAIVRVRLILAGEAPITSTATVAATLIEEAIIDAGEAAITATATVVLAAVVRKVPQPELTLTVNNIIGSSNAEEQQDSLALLVGV